MVQSTFRQQTNCNVGFRVVKPGKSPEISTPVKAHASRYSAASPLLFSSPFFDRRGIKGSIYESVEHACEDQDVGGAVSCSHFAPYAIRFDTRESACSRIVVAYEFFKRIPSLWLVLPSFPPKDDEIMSNFTTRCATGNIIATLVASGTAGFLFAYSFIRSMQDDCLRDA